MIHVKRNLALVALPFLLMGCGNNSNIFDNSFYATLYNLSLIKRTNTIFDSLNSFNCYFDDNNDPGEQRYNTFKSIFDLRKYRYVDLPFEQYDENCFFTYEGHFEQYPHRYYIFVIPQIVLEKISKEIDSFYDLRERNRSNKNIEYGMRDYYSGIPFMIARGKNLISQCKWYETDNLSFLDSVKNPKNIGLIIKARKMKLQENISLGQKVDKEYTLLERCPISIKAKKEDYGDYYQFKEDKYVNEMVDSCIFNIDVSADLNQKYLSSPHLFNSNISYYFKNENDNVVLDEYLFNHLCEEYGTDVLDEYNIRQDGASYNDLKQFIKYTNSLK